MIKSISRMLAWLLVLTVTVLAPIFAYAQNGAGEIEQVYTIEKGDTLVELLGKNFNDPTLWAEIIKMNPFLKESGRQFTKNGKFIVLIRPGEQLKGLNRLGVIPNPVDIDNLRIPAPDPDLIPEIIPSLDDGAAAGSTSFGSIFAFSVFFFGIAALVSLLLYAIYRLIRWILSDPVGSGRPVVAGGITDQNATTVFQRQASNAWAVETGERLAPQNVEIISKRKGKLYGIADVGYEGSRLTKSCNGEVGYEVKFRIVGNQQGEVKTMYTLKECANDIRLSKFSGLLPGTDFRFVPVQTIPEVIPVTEPVIAQAPEPVAEPAKETSALVPSATASIIVPQGVIGVFFEQGKVIIRTSDGPLKFKDLSKCQVEGLDTGGIKVVKGAVTIKVDAQGEIDFVDTVSDKIDAFSSTSSTVLPMPKKAETA